MGKEIVILGGGIGGQVAADVLGKALRGKHRVTLIDREKDFVFSPSLLWLMVGERSPKEIQKPMARLSRRGVVVVQAEAQKIDVSQRDVETTKGTFPFDYLIIALGAELDPVRVPGFREGALNLYHLDGVEKIYKTLQDFRGKRVVILVSSSPFKCPAAPYEGGLLVHDYLARKRGLDIEVEIYSPEPFPMPVAGPKVGQGVVQMLESHGVRFYPGHKVVSIHPSEKKIIFEGAAEANYDLLIGVPPHAAPKVLKDSGLTNDAGWVPADPETLRTQYPGIFALGDAATVPIAGGKNLPKAGVFAHYQAEVVARNILQELEGKTPSHRYNGSGWCAIETGNGKAAYGAGNFYAKEGPQIKLYSPSRFWHWGKIAFEKWWLWRRF